MTATDVRDAPPTPSPAPSNEPNSVTTRDLHKSFDDTEVIHGLNMTVAPGTIVGLIGPSGCGKTTTVRLMAGLLAPSSGEARIGDTLSVDLTRAQRSRIGYLPQTPALFPDLSLIENLSFHASMYGLPLRRKRRLDELLDWVELRGDKQKRVSEASGGMQKRLALAASFVHDPDIVFLDEPTAGIDPILREKFWSQFREIAETGKTLVVTTQYVGEAGMCDFVGLMSDGEMLLLDTPKNLRKAAFSGEVVDVTTSRPLSESEIDQLREQPFVVGDVERTSLDVVRIVVDDAEAATSDLNGAFASLGVEIVEAGEHDVDYDEAFVRVVERHRKSTSDGVIDDESESPDTGSPANEPADDGSAGDGSADNGDASDSMPPPQPSGGSEPMTEQAEPSQ